MFTPSRHQARQLFFTTWEKYRTGQELEGLEAPVLEVILLHPEYHAVLDERERNLDRDYLPDSGELNPFLHMSLHLSINEQLAIGHPPGISDVFTALLARLGDRHQALHAMLECLGEIIWQANRSGSMPDQNAYLSCLHERIHKGA